MPQVAILEIRRDQFHEQSGIIRSIEKQGFGPVQVVMVDGCGVMHPRRLGSASHLGVVTQVPTIGVAKNLLLIDGLQRAQVEHMVEAVCNPAGVLPAEQMRRIEDQRRLLTPGTHAMVEHLQYRALPIVGESGTMWGVALGRETSRKPFYISVGEYQGLANYSTSSLLQ
jgi:deoxyinosine 3'endonuclease (endonuclease V)